MAIDATPVQEKLADAWVSGATVTITGITAPVDGNAQFIRGWAASTGKSILSIVQTGATGSAAWQRAGVSQTQTNRIAELWYSLGGTGLGTTITITYTNAPTSAAQVGAAYAEWHDSLGTAGWTLGANNTSAGSSTTPTTASITPIAGKNAMIAAVLVCNGGSDVSGPTNGFANIGVGITFQRKGARLVVGSTSGAYSTVYTMGGSSTWETVIAAFLAPTYVLAAASGAFAITGSAATLTWNHSGATTYTLTADAGSFALTGSAATLSYTSGVLTRNLALAAAATPGGLADWYGMYDRRALSVVSGKVSAWDDILAATGGRTPGVQVAQATAGSRPVLTGVQGSGDERVVFNNSEWMASATDAALDASPNAPIYIVTIYKATAAGPIALLGKDETSSTTYPIFGSHPSGSTHQALIATAAGGTPSASYSVSSNRAFDGTRRVELIGHELDGVNVNSDIMWLYHHAGKQVRRPSNVTRCTAGALKIILGRLAALRGTGEIDWIGVLKARPTDVTIRAIDAFGATEHGADITSPNYGTILFLSDSLGYGSQSTDPMTPADGTGTKSPSYVCVNRAPALALSGWDTSGSIHAYNYGISGDNFSRMLVDFDYQIAVNNDWTRPGPFLLFAQRGIGNYLQTAAAPSLATMKSQAVALKAKVSAMRNGRLVWSTELDRGGGPNGSNANQDGWHLGPGDGTDISVYGQRIRDFNDELVNNWQLYGHAPPVNSAALAHFLITLTAPNAAEVGVGTIYQSGEVHLFDAGYAELGNNWRDYLDANPDVLTGAGGDFRAHRRRVLAYHR